MKVCYLLSRYISHQKAGLQYQRCLALLGVQIVLEPSQADVVILHDEPWTYHSYFARIPLLHHKYVIACAVWETDRLPAHYDAELSLANEIWVPSTYCANIFKRTHTRVFVIPYVVAVEKTHSDTIEGVRKKIGYSDSLYYYYTISRACDVRKNLGAAIRAFGRQPNISALRFIVKTNDPVPRDIKMQPSVIVIDEFLSEQELHAIHGLANCFISSHCSEGWGMAIAEAMAHGKIAVATAFSGNMDYMNADNSLLVQYTIESIRARDCISGRCFWSPDMHWAYVNEDDLTDKLSFAASNREEIRTLRRRAALDMRRYSLQEVAGILQHRLRGLGF